jgi:hypothetical protein
MTETEDRCDLTEFRVSECDHCRRKAAAVPAVPSAALDPDDPLCGLDFSKTNRRRSVGPVITASLPGRCACGCGEYIDPDEDMMIAMVEGQGWTLEDCL